MLLKRLMLVRHGETDWNSSMKYQGSSNIPLNAVGREQARRTSLRLAGGLWERIISSPQARAMETSKIIAGSLLNGNTVQIHPALSEIGFGAWEGMSVTQIEEKYGEYYHRWREDPSRYTPPGGECFHHALHRVSNAFNEMLSLDAERILVICHGGTIRLTLVHLLGMDPSLVWRMKINNCSLSGIDVWERGSSLAFLNDQLHILADENTLTSLPIPF